MEKFHCACSWQCSQGICKAHVLSIWCRAFSVLPIQRGHREKKGETKQGKGTVSPWMLGEHRNMNTFTGAWCCMRKKKAFSLMWVDVGKKIICSSVPITEKLHSFVSRVEESRWIDESTSRFLRNAGRVSLPQGWKVKTLTGIHNSNYGKKQDKQQKQRKDIEVQICCLPGRRMVAVLQQQLLPLFHKPSLNLRFLGS